MQPTSVKKPEGILNLYLINVLTTFSYAVLFSSLTIYLTKYLKLSSVYTGSIVGLFIALNFALHLLSGYIGGRFLSFRAYLVIATLFKTLGLYTLNTLDLMHFFVGLSLFLVGSGISSTCYNCLFSQQFSQNLEDPQRETAFFYNYCAMNIGFFLGFILSGYFDLREDYSALLYWANGVNILALLAILAAWRYLADQQTPLTTLPDNKRKMYYGLGLSIPVLLLPLIFLALKHAALANSLVLVLGVSAFMSVYYLARKRPKKEEQNKMFAYLIMSTVAVLLWMFFFIEPIGVINFIKYNVNKVLFGYPLAVQWIMNLNTILVIVGAPLQAFLLKRLRNRGFRISMAKQFVWAFLAMALSFAFLSLGIFLAPASGLSHVIWVILYFIAQTFGQLMIGPIGYAMIGKLAPPKLQGVMMGIWLMVPGVAASLSQYCSNSMQIVDITQPITNNPGYFLAFNQFSLYALCIAAIVLLFSRKIEKFIYASVETEEAIALAQG